MTAVLSSMPSPWSLYATALATARRKPRGKPALPALAVEMHNLRADAENLAAYRALCGFADMPSLPVTYPQVMVSRLHMHLMAQPEFPLPMLGLVHLRNHIAQTRPLTADETFGVVARMGESREVRQGLEFDLVTEFSVAGELVWSSVMTILYRIPGPKSSGAPSASPTTLAQYQSFDAPADIGRRYAKVSGDHNPIHTSALGAKLFGFPRAIAHGMWTLARVAALLQPELGSAPHQLGVAFKQPLLLPGKVALKYQRSADGIAFAVLARDSEKIHLSGSLR